MTSAAYVGRFAPSPTGPLHFGSLLAAMASYCDARSHHGLWQLRIDDIDPPRAIPDAPALFQRTLHTYGFDWDGPIIFQSQRSDQYRQRLLQLNEKQRLYLCSCSRRELQHSRIYPNTCKPASGDQNGVVNAAAEVTTKLLSNPGINKAIRVSLDSEVTFEDQVQGVQLVNLTTQSGDIVVVRRDDLFAYALACAVDDADGITRVVRGADLLPTTAAQIRIMELLGLKSPAYAHIPVALNSDNQKLSKQTQAKPIDTMDTLPTLQRAWRGLGQSELDVHSIESFWQAAVEGWKLNNVPKKMTISHE